MKTINVQIKVNLVIKADDSASVSDIIDEMEMNFTDSTDTAEIEDSSIESFIVTDSR